MRARARGGRRVPTAGAGSRPCRESRRRSRSRAGRCRCRARARRSPSRRAARPRRAAARCRAAAAACSRRDTARSAACVPRRAGRRPCGARARPLCATSRSRSCAGRAARAAQAVAHASPSALARIPSSGSSSSGFQSATVRSARGAASPPITVASHAEQRVRELARIRDRRRREQELRIRAVHARQPSQPPQDVRDVRAEDAAVHVCLVDDDVAQVVQDVAPAVVARQNPDVEHVGVRQDSVRPAADLRAPLLRRVAVVDRRRERAGRRALRARAPGPARAPSSDRGRARGSSARRASASSTGRLKASVLPDAVPVVTISARRAALRPTLRAGARTAHRRRACETRGRRGGAPSLPPARARSRDTRAPRPGAGRPSSKADHVLGIDCREVRVRGGDDGVVAARRRCDHTARTFDRARIIVEAPSTVYPASRSGGA